MIDSDIIQLLLEAQLMFRGLARTYVEAAARDRLSPDRIERERTFAAELEAKAARYAAAIDRLRQQEVTT